MQRNDRRRFFAGFLAFLVPLSAVLALPAAVTLPSDKWFVIAIADVPVGYAPPAGGPGGG